MTVDTSLILTIGAVAGALTAVFALLGLIARKTRHVRRRINAVLDDWLGEPARPGYPGRPSMPERVTALEAGLAEVQLQVTPNGGNTDTLGDRAVRIEKALGTDPDSGGG